MTEEDFLISKANSITLLKREIDKLNREEQRYLVNPYDTGVGGADHNYKANELAKQNGKVSLEYRLKTRQYYDVIDKLAECTTTDELWDKLTYDCTTEVEDGKLTIIDCGYCNETSKAWRIVGKQFWK